MKSLLPEICLVYTNEKLIRDPTQSFNAKYIGKTKAEKRFWAAAHNIHNSLKVYNHLTKSPFFYSFTSILARLFFLVLFEYFSLFETISILLGVEVIKRQMTKYHRAYKKRKKTSHSKWAMFKNVGLMTLLKHFIEKTKQFPGHVKKCNQ